MRITSYLIFDGEAEAAADFYAGALGGRIENLHRYADFPPVEGAPPVADEYRQRVGHCCIAFPGGSISLADTALADPLAFGNGHMLTLSADSAAEAETLWTRLSEGAQKIACPLQEAFFARRYGELTDRFGVQWAVMYDER